MNARLFSVASVVISLPLRVARMPERGATTSAQAGQMGIGDAAEVMLAAARQGATVYNSACLGTGPNSSVARRLLRDAGIMTTTDEVVGDIGMKMMLLEDEGFYTSVLCPGVEADLAAQDLFSLEIESGDMVYLSAGDLVYPSYREALANWLPSLPEQVTVVMAATPMIAQVETDWLADILPWVNLLTANHFEAQYLPGLDKNRNAPTLITSEFIKDYLAPGGRAVQRVGADGSLIVTQEGTRTIPSVIVAIKDTLGVGAAHTGVMIGSLLNGVSLAKAVRRANVAGAVVTTRTGSDVCPAASELDAILIDDPIE